MLDGLDASGLAILFVIAEVWLLAICVVILVLVFGSRR